jgi:hypothetical protein
MLATRTGPDVQRRPCIALVALMFALLSPSLAAAAPLDDVEVHGFASQGFILTVENDYLADGTTDGSFELAEAGINFTARLTETFRIGIQLFAQDLGPSGNYAAQLDWFYLDYRWRDWLGVRAGRLKIPYGLYNEVQDIDAARVPVLLPQSVYPLQTREILFAQTGGEVYGFVRTPSLGALDYRLFGGTIFIDGDSLTTAGSTVELEVRVPYVIGGRLIWETPLEGLRVGGSFEALRLKTTAFVPMIPAIHITNHSQLWVGFAELVLSDLQISAEYSRWNTDQRSDMPMLSQSIHSLSERAYLMAAYRLAPWFQPGAYYSVLFPNVHDREGRENKQHDLAATLRFDINAYWLVKLEGHYMIGTAGLVNPARTSVPDLAGADEHWAAFFVKTTAHF